MRRMEREEKRRYQEERAAETEALNEELRQDIEALENLLIEGIGRDARLDWQVVASVPARHEPDASLVVPDVPALETLLPPSPGLFARLIPGSEERHEREVERVKEEHTRLAQEHVSLSQRRSAAIERQRKEMCAGYAEGRPEAVSEVFEIVLESSPLPDGFPRTTRTGYMPESRQLVVDYQLPAMGEIIPENDRYRYNKSSDAIIPTRRAVRAGQNLYARVVAMVVLRCLHEVFAADEASMVEVVAVNAFVDTTDPSTGKRIQPYLISVRVTLEPFGHLELAHVDALQCPSGYGSAAFEFAKGKPIELLDGSNLLYLLKEHAGIGAKIEVPEDWVDARLDAGAEA